MSDASAREPVRVIVHKRAQETLDDTNPSTNHNPHPNPNPIPEILLNKSCARVPMR